jgi:hypothetical protein
MHQIERSDSCPSDEDVGLDNDIFIEYVRTADPSKVAELIEALNQEPVVNNSLGACPKCRQRQSGSNKFFVRIKPKEPTRKLHISSDPRLQTTISNPQKGEYFKKQLQRLFENRSSSPTPYLGKGSRKLANQSKSGLPKFNANSSTLVPSYHSIRSQADLKQHNYNIDDFLKHY